MPSPDAECQTMQKENIRMDQNEENIQRHTVDVVAEKVITN